jgi:hypothetical protein
MDLVNWIIANREVIKIFYGLIVGIICLIIVGISHRLYHLSSYEGIRYFRNAFLFFGIAFIIRYVFGGFAHFEIISSDFTPLIIILFEFFLIMAGFFLIYSLIWKRIEGPKGSFSSILNSRILIFYVMAFIVTILDYLWGSYYFLFISQVIVFVCATAMSYINYSRNGKKRGFLKFYLLAMILALVAWIVNAVTAAFFNWERTALIYVYTLNIIIFIVFLYGILRITRKSGRS